MPMPAADPGRAGEAQAPTLPDRSAGLVPLAPSPQAAHSPQYSPQPQYSPPLTYQPPPTYGAPTYAGGYQVQQYPRPGASGGHIAVAWIVAVLTLGYMLPWAIAATRGRPNTLAIALLNLLVGWTFLGWVAALVMACLSDPSVTVAAPTFVQVNTPGPAAAPPPGWYLDGSGASRYWDGRSWVGDPSR